MKPETKKKLDEARGILGKCASRVSTLRTTSHPLLDDNERELCIGLGTARDWIRWATALEDLTFSTKSETLSARTQGITESVRFNQMWTATNALFAKDSILSIASAPLPLSKNVKGIEFKRFEVLYRFANIDTALERSCLDNLNALLSMECATPDVTGELKADGTPTMWEVIYHKYMRPEDRTRSIGKTIGNAIAHAKSEHAKITQASRKDQPSLSVDGPTLIYAARNWAVHGMLITSFFRGSKQKYISFIDNIALLLSAVLEGASKKLLAKV